MPYSESSVRRHPFLLSYTHSHTHFHFLSRYDYSKIPCRSPTPISRLRTDAATVHTAMVTAPLQFTCKLSVLIGTLMFVRVWRMSPGTCRPSSIVPVAFGVHCFTKTAHALTCCLAQARRTERSPYWSVGFIRPRRETFRATRHVETSPPETDDDICERSLLERRRSFNDL